MFSGPPNGWTDEWGVFHASNAPDMGDAGPHESGAKIVKQTTAQEKAYRKRLAEVAKIMDEGRDAYRRGEPGADWSVRLDELRHQAQAEQAERATTALSPSQTAQDVRTPVLPTSTPLPPVSDAVGRSLLARWRRRR
jgi:hypothetical protein